MIILYIYPKNKTGISNKSAFQYSICKYSQYLVKGHRGTPVECMVKKMKYYLASKRKEKSVVCDHMCTWLTSC